MSALEALLREMAGEYNLIYVVGDPLLRAFLKCPQYFVTGYQAKRIDSVKVAPLKPLALKHVVKIVKQVPQKGKDDSLLDFF